MYLAVSIPFIFNIIEIMKVTFLENVISSPLIGFAAAFMAGIPFAKVAKLPMSLYLISALILFLISLAAWRLGAKQKVALLLIPLFFVYGALRFELSNQPYPTDHISFYHNSERHVYLTGSVQSLPDERDQVTNLKLSVKYIDLGFGDLPASGSVLVKLYTPYPTEYGDIVRVYGVMDAPPESPEFSYREYLLNQGITTLLTTNNLTILPGEDASLFGKLTTSVRRAIFERVEQIFPPPSASLVNGILVGLDKQIPPEIAQAFVDTGTSHIIAISGFNISIITAILITLFTRLAGKRWGTLLSVLGIGIYTLIAGADPPVVRSALMGGLAAFGILIGRRNATLTLLFFAGMIMAFIEPATLFEPGFQLSFAATLGIISMVPPMENWVRERLSTRISEENLDGIVTVITDLFLITFAAQATTLPVILAHFGKLPLITFLANPLILPLQPPLLILSGAAVILSYLWIPAGQILGMAAYPFAWATIRIVEWLAPYSGPSLHFNLDNTVFIVIYYSVLLFAGAAWQRIKSWFRPAILLPAALVGVFLIWQQAGNLPDGKTHILIPAAGKTDLLLITTSNGEHILINGGDKSSILLEHLGQTIPAFDQQIDLLVIANTQEGNLSALPKALRLYPPQRVVWSGNREASYSSQALSTSLLADKIPFTFIQTGDVIDLGGGLALKALNVNQRGAVYLLSQGGFSLFLPIGVNREALEELVREEPLAVTGYYLSENGYPPANPPDLIDSYPAEFYLFGFGFDNFAILPNEQLLASLDTANLFRTDVNGWIEIVVEADEYSIRTQHGD